MIILLTGSSGFVGQNLMAYLKCFTIHQLSVRYKPQQSFDINQSDIIVHLAGKAHDRKKTANANEYNRANFELTKQLFDAFLESDAQKFIFVSSVKAVADNVSDILTENCLPHPQGPYGISKQKAEAYILSKSLPINKSFYILRPCMIHGVGNKGNLNLLYKLVSKGFPWPLGAFDNKRSFLSIENLCFIIKELIDREDIPSGVYNVADDQSLSSNELICLISNSLGKTPKIWKIPSNIVKIMVKIGDFMHLPLNTVRLNKLTESFIVNNQKIVTAIGKPLPIQAKDGLIKTFKSFNNNK